MNILLQIIGVICISVITLAIILMLFLFAFNFFANILFNEMGFPKKK